MVTGDKKVSELPQISAPSQTDLMYIAASGEPRAVSRANLLKVVDNLSGDSTVDPLSARQGSVLLGLINNIVIRQGTFAEMQALSAENPTLPFFCVVTMDDGAHGMLYLGVTSSGFNGFIDLGGGTPVNNSEVG